MAMRQLILRTETRNYHIRTKIPNDPNDIGQNLVVAPEAHRLFSRFGKPEIECSCEELFAVIDPPRSQQFRCSNYAEPLAQFRAEQILTAVPARDRKVRAVIK